MRTTTLSYEFANDHRYQNITTDCIVKHQYGIKIGSAKCQKCEYFHSVDENMQEVKCLYDYTEKQCLNAGKE